MRPVLPPTPHAIGSSTPSSVPFVLFEALWHTRIAASEPWHRLSRDFCPVPHLRVVLYPFRQRMSRLHGTTLYHTPARSGRDKRCGQAWPDASTRHGARAACWRDRVHLVPTAYAVARICRARLAP